MKLKANINIVKEVSNNIFKILLFISMLESIPILTSVIYKEYNIAIYFGISMCISILICSIGYLLTNNYVKVKSNFGLSLVVASLSWIGASLIAAFPMYLCGNFYSFLDAFFDAISGFTTSGFSLIVDIDHLSKGVNMFRHLIAYIGGQGIIVFAAVFVIKGSNSIYKMYEAEARDERIYPSTKHTAIFIIRIGLIFMFIGTTALTLIGIRAGLKADNAFFHALWIFMSSWSECGFAPMSQNLMYYHSFLYEFVCILLCLLSAISFIVHFSIIKGNRKELIQNDEVKTYFKLITFIVIVTLLGLKILGVYTNAISYARRCVFQMISACTTSGFCNVYTSKIATGWGGVATILITIAMLCGGTMNCQSGGIKIFRIKVILKTIQDNIRKTFYPQGAIILKKIHHGKDIIISDEMFKSASMMFICYILMFTIVMLATTACGYQIPQAMIESSSIIGNVGISSGITNPAMPTALKYVYIIAMWVVRLEFVSAFMLIGFVFKIFKKKGVTKVELEMEE